jgi:hypothetical protein
VQELANNKVVERTSETNAEHIQLCGEVKASPVLAASACSLAIDSLTEQEVVEAQEPADAVVRPTLRRRRTWPLCVSFDLDPIVHSITPYAEIYGMHPRYFDFDKGLGMVPAQGFGASRVAPQELTCREDAENDDVASEVDDWSDDEFCIEYCLVPQDVPQTAPVVVAC